METDRWPSAAAIRSVTCEIKINRVFDDFWGESRSEPRRETGTAAFWPQINVTETDKEIKVYGEIPGVDPKDIDVSVEDGALIIKGEKKYEREAIEKGQYRMERSYGAFERTIALPGEVDESKAKAELKKGVLKLTLLKRPGAASRAPGVPALHRFLRQIRSDGIRPRLRHDEAGGLRADGPSAVRPRTVGSALQGGRRLPRALLRPRRCAIPSAAFLFSCRPRPFGAAIRCAARAAMTGFYQASDAIRHVRRPPTAG